MQAVIGREYPGLIIPRKCFIRKGNCNILIWVSDEVMLGCQLKVLSDSFVSLISLTHALLFFPLLSSWQIRSGRFSG